jgi:hypothetical protein
VLTQEHKRNDSGAKFALRVHFVLAFKQQSLFCGQRLLLQQTGSHKKQSAQFLFAVGGDKFLFGSMSFYAVVLTATGQIEMVLLNLKKHCRLEVSVPLEHARLNPEVINAGLAFVADQLVNKRHKFHLHADLDDKAAAKVKRKRKLEPPIFAVLTSVAHRRSGEEGQKEESGGEEGGLPQTS